MLHIEQFLDKARLVNGHHTCHKKGHKDYRKSGLNKNREQASSPMQTPTFSAAGSTSSRKSKHGRKTDRSGMGGFLSPGLLIHMARVVFGGLVGHGRVVGATAAPIEANNVGHQMLLRMGYFA